MNKRTLLLLFTIIIVTSGCNNHKPNRQSIELEDTIAQLHTDTVKAEQYNKIIIDSQLTFEEALYGTKAPVEVIEQLVLFDVQYLSTDGRIHQGQIMSNKELEKDIKHMFEFMLKEQFIVEKAIPAVHYNWSDSLSMDDNNSYSFCYRNISYSKHAHGMAIDINPRFNPLRWKKEKRPNQPQGAILDTTVNGTLHPNHIVVSEFKKLGFRWGHTFSKYYDDHHFEK